MSENQPREYDAVLGGGNQPPIYGVVLGGIEGVKRRLANSVADVRAIAITQAANYGIEGLDLIIEALNDCSGIVRGVAYEILKQKLKEPFMQGSKTRVRKELGNFDILRIFTTLDDWVVQDFNPDIGIIDTSSIAYNVNSSEELKTLLNSPKVSKLQALSLNIESDEINFAADIFLNNHKHLFNLRILCISEIKPNTISNLYCKGEIDIGEILKFFPYLNLLKIGGVGNIKFSKAQHKYLNTLIINSYFLTSINAQQMQNLEANSLEYLDLIISGYKGNKVPDYLLSCSCLQKLKYLALRDSNNCNRIVSLLIRENIINNLKILDISDGDLTNKGANYLLKCSLVNNLRIINVSRNYLSPEMVQKLSKLKCKVIANSQKHHRY